MSPALLDSLAFNLLIRSYRRLRHTRLEALWWKLYRRFRQRNRTVRSKLHGYPVVLNFAYPYPLTIRTYPTFNAPLLELVHLLHRVRNRKIRLADVGAAMGDTVLLVEANCPGMVAQYVCVDGDKELFSYLEQNLRPISSKLLIQAQLSRSGGERPDLVRVRPDCVSSQGSSLAPTCSLQEVFEARQVGSVDLLKIDVEGYDGEVLLGCEQRLAQDRPAILFEWHPILCQGAGTTRSEHFEMLARLGYSNLLWFNKFGEFSHFSDTRDAENRERLAAFCLASKTRDDWHYDIVALPPDLASHWQEMAELEFARRRPSWA
jgi:FkbM family methyltransferase